jgi:hypothetical protein
MRTGHSKESLIKIPELLWRLRISMALQDAFVELES